MESFDYIFYAFCFIFTATFILLDILGYHNEVAKFIVSFVFNLKKSVIILNTNENLTIDQLSFIPKKVQFYYVDSTSNVRILCNNIKPFFYIGYFFYFSFLTFAIPQLFYYEKKNQEYCLNGFICISKSINLTCEQALNQTTSTVTHTKLPTWIDSWLT